VAATAFRRVVSGLDPFPLVSLQVEGVKIVESNALVVETTMATEDVDLVVE